MRSHLTRRVIRTILRNEPLRYKNCPRRLHLLSARQARPAIAPIRPSLQSRSVWWGWLTSKPTRVLRPQKIDPGMETLAEQETLLEMGARKYSNADLVEALRELFKHKEATRKPVLDTQINAILATYKYLLGEREHDKQASLTVQETALYLKQLGNHSRTTQARITVLSERDTDAFAALADLFLGDIKNRSAEWSTSVDDVANEAGEKRKEKDDAHLTSFKECVRSYLDLMAYRLKKGTHARETIQALAKDYPSFVNDIELFRPIVWAFAFERKHEELKSFLAWLEKTNPTSPENLWDSMIEGAVLSEDIESVKDLWSNQSVEAKSNMKFTRRFVLSLTILKLCITSGNMSWGQNILNDIVGMKLTNLGHRSKQMAMILSWAMASGKSVDELEKMFDVLCNRLELAPRIDEINSVLEMAKFKNDPYYAERLLGLARKKQLRFDATTYKLEMEWRILAGDITGAQVSYDRLRSQEFDIEEISPAINQLLLAMCRREPLPHQQIMDIVGELTASDGVFSAELIAALAKLHLERGEMHDLADLLHTYATSFTSAERDIIRGTFERYIFEAESSGGKWDAYTFLKAIFPEATRTVRVDIMREFFRVGRHDLAMHVFGDMRAAQIQNQRPDNAAYATFFEGLAHTRKFEALQIAHNMLRLDSQIEPDTNIRTSLMLAYALCDKPGRAMTIWDEIVFTPEGPSYRSVNVALRACQEAEDGLQRARDIWSKLKQQDVEITKETADSYIAALASYKQLDEAFNMVSDLGAVSGSHNTADALSIAAVINPTTDEQREAALLWAQERYPEQLKQVEAAGKSPFERRYLLQRLLPEDGSYVGYWNMLGAHDWEVEYIDWTKMAKEE